MANGRDIKFAPDDRIDASSHEVIQRLFGIEGAILTNESSLDDFLESPEFPGHKLVRYTDIPESERPKYPVTRYGNVARRWEWYPPVTPEEWQQVRKDNRRKFLALLESAYGISFDEYPENEELHVWKVARHLAEKRGDLRKRFPN